MKISKSITLFSKVLLLVVSTSFTVAMAEDQACVPEGSVKFAFQNFEFQQMDEYGHVAKTYKEDEACDKGILQATIGAIDYIRKVPNKKIPANFQTLVSKEGPTNFLTKRIQTIQFESEDSTDCSEGTIAFVVAEEPIMHVCPRAIKLKAMEIAAFLEHEARHTEGHPHVSCSQGILKDFDALACDNTYKEQGSYGIGLGFLFQVYFSTTNEGVKQQARAAAVQDVLNRFNQLPLGMVKGGVFVDEEDSVSFYDGKEETQFATMADEIATISFINNIPYIFFKNGNITSYDFTRNWNFREGPLVDNYMALSQQDRNDLLDVLSNKDEYCYLTPKRVQCTQEDSDDFAEFAFYDLRPQRFVNVNQSYTGGIVVIAGDGKSYKLPKSTQFGSAKESDLTIDTKSHIYPEVTSYAEMSNGRILGVSPKGLMLEKTKSGKWVRTKEFGDYKFKKILPYKWSKRLEDL
ncbi:hypothetical protein [Bdellovibrio sp. HCB274]|uniref:hypothetical protein n=1 Tax=Bdellovibrio sp. HCB274 TaxID=3394361 RepID=UPI0039B45D8E